MGRPSSSVPKDTADQIIEWISSGDTLRAFCRQEGMPHYGTVYNWINKDADFAERFARARDIGEEVIIQECLEIADDARNDWMDKFNKEGDVDGRKFDAEHVQRSKLRIETRLKLLAKWNPKKYGDRVTNQLVGPNDGPIKTEATVVDVHERVKLLEEKK